MFDFVSSYIWCGLFAHTLDFFQRELMLNRWQQTGGQTGWHRNQELSKFFKVAVVARASTTISDVARLGLAQDVQRQSSGFLPPKPSEGAAAITEEVQRWEVAAAA